MYNKIKATKNNGLKKASVLAAVALLTSLVVFARSEQLELSETSAFGSRFGSWGGGLFSSRPRLNWSGTTYADLFSTYRQRPLNENQSENVKAFEDNLSRFDSEASRILGDAFSLGRLPELRDLMGQAGTARAVVLGVEKLLKKSGLDAAGRATRGREAASEVGNLIKILKGLKKLQLDLWANIIYLTKALNFERIKNPDKLRLVTDKVEKEHFGDKYNIIEGLLAKAGVINVTHSATGEALNEAKVLAKKALTLFWEGRTFGEEGDSNDEWMSFGYGYREKTTSSLVKPYKCALHVLLHFNKTINDIYRVLGMMRMARAWRQALRALAGYGKGATVAALSEKEYMFQAFDSVERPEFNALPLCFADGGTLSKDGVEARGTSRIVKNRAEFTKHLVDAVDKNSGKDLSAIVNSFLRYADTATNDGENLEVSYDVAKVFTSALGDSGAKMVLKGLDKEKESLLSDDFISQLKASQSTFELTDEEFKSFEEFQKSFREESADFRFVSRDNLVSTIVDVSDDSRGAVSDLLALAWGAPDTLKLRALVDCYISDMNSAAGGYTEQWDDELKAWVDSKALSSALSNVVSELSKVYDTFGEMAEAISKVKHKKLSESEKTEAKRKSSKITNILVRGSDNRNYEGIKVKAISDEASGSVAIEVSGLPEGVTAISPVLCPKTASDEKAGNTNVDLPIAEVVNGTATINLANYMKQRGNSELHLRQVIKDPATGAVKEYKFLVKVNLSYDVRAAKAANALSTKVEQSDNSKLDYSTVDVFHNEDKSITFRIKAKSGVSVGDRLTCVYFKQGSPANMEHDKFALESDGSYYYFTTNKNQEGSMQLHIYNGEVEESKYDGKVEVSTSATTDMPEEGKGLGLTEVVAKGDYSSSTVNKAVVTKTVCFVLPESLVSSGQEVDYSIVDGDGRVVRTGSTTLRFVKNKGGSRYGGFFDGYSEAVYRGDIDIPKTNKEYRIRFEGLDISGAVLEGSNIKSDMAINKEIDLKPLSMYDFLY